MLFRDRVDAGRQLAARLRPFAAERPVVLGLPRGGVPVASEVATVLGAPLDVIVVRKLGVPYQPELGFGAVGEGGVVVLNQEIIHLAGVSDAEIRRTERRERAELERRVDRFRSGHARVDLAGRTVIVVDDGIATGSTARAACRVARAQGATRVVLAVPVAPIDFGVGADDGVDELVCLETPEPFGSVGRFYRDFRATSDDDVVACLDRARAGAVGARDEEVEVTAGRVRLAGHLSVPAGATGVVVFAHGSGSSRFSPRNRYVASVLQDAGLGTLLLDLLTAAEEGDRTNVFDVELLGRRLVDVTAWLHDQPGAAHLPVGYFGASTGAAAALWAAAEPGQQVAAVVSRGGRPDLTPRQRLAAVRAPTLLIVGADDTVVLELNRRAQAQLTCESHLAVVPGATHLFEEPGTLELAAAAARDWFVRHVLQHASVA